MHIAITNFVSEISKWERKSNDRLPELYYCDALQRWKKEFTKGICVVQLKNHELPPAASFIATLKIPLFALYKPSLR